MPVIYHFTGPGKLIDWAKEKMKSCKENLEKKNKKMFEIDGLKTLITCIFMSETSFTLDVR